MKASKIINWFFLGLGVSSVILSFFRPSCLLCDVQRTLFLFIAVTGFLSFFLIRLFFTGTLFLISAYHSFLNLLPLENYCTLSGLSMKRLPCTSATIVQIYSIPLPVIICFISAISFAVLFYEYKKKS